MTTKPLTSLVALALAAVALAACGDDPGRSDAPAGSPENPLVAERPEQAGGAAPDAADEATSERGGTPAGARSEPTAPESTPEAPGYEALVERQRRKPRERFTPCNLVSEREAQAIVGAPMQAPVEARQGPTCIYRTRTGKGFIALAVQATDFASIKKHMRKLRRVAISDRAGYCGAYGQPMLYVPLGSGRVLAVSAECDVAKDFALKALQHL